MPRFISDLHLETFFSREEHPLKTSAKRIVSSTAFPLAIVSGLLLLDGVFSASFTSVGIGILGMVGAQAIKIRDQ